MGFLKTNVAVLGVAAILCGAGASRAQTAAAPAQMSREELVREVQDLRQRLAKLEAAVLGAAPSAPAETPAPAATVTPAGEPGAGTATPQKVDVVSTGAQPLSFTGLVDVYYSNNFNNPVSGDNKLFYTSPNAKGFGLNHAKLEINAQPFNSLPVGVRADIWFGSGARLFRQGLEPGPLEDVIFLQQAYGYYNFNNGSTLNVGLFGTIAGLEVAESHKNWNYSRGLLWAWNEPFSHLGAKYTTPITDTLSGTVMLVNGFDSARDNNTGKSYGLQGSWAPSDKFTTTLTWIHGPENFATSEGWRKDVSWNFAATLHPRFQVMSNFDSIWNTNPDGSTQTSWGIGGYARVNLADKWAFSQRFEYFDDTEARSTGVEHILKEYTATLEYKPISQLITRLEYRRDWSTLPFFERGNEPFSTNNQDTLTLGMMWIFGPE